MGYDLTKFDLPSDADDFIEVALLGLGLIDRYLTHGAASGILSVIKAVLTSVQNAYDGKVTCEEVRKEFASLIASLAANDEAADEALQKKFGAQKQED